MRLSYKSCCLESHGTVRRGWHSHALQNRIQGKHPLSIYELAVCAPSCPAATCECQGPAVLLRATSARLTCWGPRAAHCMLSSCSTGCRLTHCGAQTAAAPWCDRIALLRSCILGECSVDNSVSSGCLQCQALEARAASHTCGGALHYLGAADCRLHSLLEGRPKVLRAWPWSVATDAQLAAAQHRQMRAVHARSSSLASRSQGIARALCGHSVVDFAGHDQGCGWISIASTTGRCQCSCGAQLPVKGEFARPATRRPPEGFDQSLAGVIFLVG